MRKSVIAAVIVGTVGFGGLAAMAGIAEAATASAAVRHPVPATKGPHKGVHVAKPKPKVHLKPRRHTVKLGNVGHKG